MKKQAAVAKPDTLVIYYKDITGLPPETIKPCKNPDKVLANRNAAQIKKVNYGGKPFDFDKHIKLYPVKPEEAIPAVAEEGQEG